jgi:hypothetical protein
LRLAVEAIRQRKLGCEERIARRHPRTGNILAVGEFIRTSSPEKPRAVRGLAAEPEYGSRSGSQEADFVAGDFEFQGVPVGRPVSQKPGRPFDEFAPLRSEFWRAASRCGPDISEIVPVPKRPESSFCDLPRPVQNQNPRGVVSENSH